MTVLREPADGRIDTSFGQLSNTLDPGKLQKPFHGMQGEPNVPAAHRPTADQFPAEMPDIVCEKLPGSGGGGQDVPIRQTSRQPFLLIQEPQEFSLGHFLVRDRLSAG
ncbi:MAG TPA: hypothetical protein VMV94_16195 [Phycisphaerae bacterium]|nr:hypothetical protein [Phycisphaerae bacterium]